MESLFRIGSSRRKAEVPGEFQVVKAKSSKISDDENDDVDDDGNDDENLPVTIGNGVPNNLSEGTVVVQPEPVDETPVKKKPPVRIDTSVLGNVCCSACDFQLNPYKRGSVHKHAQLKVVICKHCSKFLSSGEISKDQDGADEQCRWCGNSGRLMVCDDCSSAFCKSCVKRNFSTSEMKNIKIQDNWQCYFCNQKPLQSLQIKYRQIRDTLKVLHEKKKTKTAALAASTASTSAQHSKKNVESKQSTKHIPTASTTKGWTVISNNVSNSVGVEASASMTLLSSEDSNVLLTKSASSSLASKSHSSSRIATTSGSLSKEADAKLRSNGSSDSKKSVVVQQISSVSNADSDDIVDISQGDVSRFRNRNKPVENMNGDVTKKKKKQKQDVEGDDSSSDPLSSADDDTAPVTRRPRRKGPKSSKKGVDYDDLSSDEHEKNDELPVTFFWNPEDTEGQQDLDENEIAKKGFLEDTESENDNNEEAEGDSSSAEDSGPKSSKKGVDYDDLSSDEHEKNDELPVTFFWNPEDTEGQQDLDENEIAKKGFLEDTESENDNNEEAEGDSSSAEDSGPKSSKKGVDYDDLSSDEHEKNDELPVTFFWNPEDTEGQQDLDENEIAKKGFLEDTESENDNNEEAEGDSSSAEDSGPKSSKKGVDYDDLSSDEHEKNDELPVTFFWNPEDTEGQQDLDENEIAKKGFLEDTESENDNNEEAEGDSSSAEDSDEEASKETKNDKKKITIEPKQSEDINNEDSTSSEKDEDSNENNDKRKKIRRKLLDAKLFDSDLEIGSKKKKKNDDDDDGRSKSVTSSGSSVKDGSKDDNDDIEVKSKKKGRKRGKKNKKRKGKEK